MACAAALHKARTSEHGLMSKVVHWTKAEVKPYSPVTGKHVKDGLTVAQLCEAAITLSDNTAGNMVLKQIGGPAGLTRYFRTLKDSRSRLDRWESELNDWTPKERRHTTTPASIARGLRAVTTGNALDVRDRKQLNTWLVANQTGDAREPDVGVAGLVGFAPAREVFAGEFEAGLLNELGMIVEVSAEQVEGLPAGVNLSSAVSAAFGGDRVGVGVGAGFEPWCRAADVDGGFRHLAVPSVPGDVHALGCVGDHPALGFRALERSLSCGGSIP